MAEAVAITSIAKSTLQLFTSLAKDEFLLLWHSRRDLERLRATIETISDFLLDAEERKSKDRSVQRCLSDLRKVMYDVEDLFDALAAHTLHKKVSMSNTFTKEVRLFFSVSNRLGFIFRTHEVKSLRRSLDEIAKNMKQFSFIQQSQLVVDRSFMRKKTHSFVYQEDIIGRDEDKDRIINMLIHTKEGETSRKLGFSVVAIIGFGGMGKTALAQFVYNDERVKQGFDVHLWACINYLSNLEHVLKEIIASKVERKQLDLSVQMLQEKLREIIDRKKFLIVLDDVWDENSGNWLELETILRCGKSGSKVLVTTRSAKVAKCLHASEPHCDLRGLSEESAWSLFVKKAFQGEEPSKHPELAPIGKKILNKCGNVPLAILTVASLLGQKRREEIVWREFFDNKLKEVLSSGVDDNSVKQVLMVSYNDLHPNLKLCFAVCSLFAKDYKFDKDHLVQLWISQGILKPCVHNNQSLEEVGEVYFFHLVDRCFFQEVDYGHRYKYTAKMHDLLHDMAIDVAKSEYLFMDKVGENKGAIDGLRHISVAFGLEDSFDCCSLVADPKIVRTFLFHHKKKFSKSSFKSLLGSFSRLRTLYLSNSGIDEVPESIGGLIHLRYLDLSFNAKLKNLPNSICKLHHLMIFVLEGCYLLEKLPPRIEKLVSLRQLFIGGCNSLDSLPSGLKKLTSLVNLDRLIVHRVGGGLGYLNGLDHLAGILRIELPREGWLDAIEDAKKSNLVMKNKLNEMSIEWKRRSTTGEQEMAREEAKAVLEALQPHENLQHLRVGNYGGEMLSSWFGMLKCVKVLQLYECDNVEYIEDGIKGNMCFPSLKLLTIEAMRNLKGWWRQEKAQGKNRPRLSSVSSFAIFRCPKLKGRMPLFDGVEYLDLSEVDVEVVRKLLVPFNNNNSKLKELQLCAIEGLIDLPKGWMRHLTALQRLTIEHCRGLRQVSRRGLAHLTALKTISLGEGSGEIGDENDDEDDAAGMPWKALQGLVSLTVGVGDSYLLEGLPYLTSLGVLGVEKWKDVKLQLGGGEVMKGVALFPAEALRNLRTLSMGFDNETFHFPRSGIRHLRSLSNLNIRDCKDLYLCWETLLSMKLETLELKRVEKVIDVEEDVMMVAEQHSLLRNLKISEEAGAKWVDDIPWISLSSSLDYLCLKGMGERKQLPDGIQHLTSLRTLEIGGCEQVTTLPNWISQLPTLRRLSIQGCSAELKRRCQRGRGDDWLLICHLPHTYFY